MKPIIASLLVLSAACTSAQAHAADVRASVVCTLISQDIKNIRGQFRFNLTYSNGSQKANETVGDVLNYTTANDRFMVKATGIDEDNQDAVSLIDLKEKRSSSARIDFSLSSLLLSKKINPDIENMRAPLIQLAVASDKVDYLSGGILAADATLLCGIESIGSAK